MRTPGGRPYRWAALPPPPGCGWELGSPTATGCGTRWATAADTAGKSSDLHIKHRESIYNAK